MENGSEQLAGGGATPRLGHVTRVSTQNTELLTACIDVIAAIETIEPPTYSVGPKENRRRKVAAGRLRALGSEGPLLEWMEPTQGAAEQLGRAGNLAAVIIEATGGIPEHAEVDDRSLLRLATRRAKLPPQTPPAAYEWNDRPGQRSSGTDPDGNRRTAAIVQLALLLTGGGTDPGIGARGPASR